MKKVLSLAIITMCMIGCNQNEPDTEVYEVAGNIYRYSNEDEFDLNAPDAADRYNGKTMVSYEFNFINSERVDVSFSTNKFSKFSETRLSTSWVYENYVCKYKRRNMNDIYIYDDTHTFYVKAKKDHIIYNGMIFSLYEVPVVVADPVD